MASSAASDRNRQSAAFAGVEREQEVDEAEKAFQERSCRRVGRDVRAYLWILAGQRFELRFVVRVAQKAHVKKQIHLRREAVFESEGLDLHGQPSAQHAH